MALSSVEMLQSLQSLIENMPVTDAEHDDDRFKTELRPTTDANRRPGRVVVVIPGGSIRVPLTQSCEHEMDIVLVCDYPTKGLLKAVADSSEIAETLYGWTSAADISRVEVEPGLFDTTGHGDIRVSRALRVKWIRS